jgi:Uma2 family endonuclease
MANTLLSGEQILLENITWGTYERLLREAGERRIRMTYNNGDLEIMTLSFGHENVAELIARLVSMITLVLNVPVRSGGSTTLKKKLNRKGLEPDKCFWIKNERAMRGKTKWEVKRDPPPDLVVEVDVSRSSMNRMGIYAALGVLEVWRYKGKRLRVYELVKGKYREVQVSPSFPYLPMARVNEFLHLARSVDETTLLREFESWVRQDVLPLAEDAPRSNGKKSGKA